MILPHDLSMILGLIHLQHGESGQGVHAHKDAGSWKAKWFVPVEVLIRPTNDRFPRKDKSHKKNRRKLRKGRTKRPSRAFQAKRIRKKPNDFAGS